MNKLRRKTFPDYSTFLDYVETVPPTWRNQASKRDEIGHSPPWAGTETFAGAIDLARNGWPAGREYLAELDDGAVALPNEMLTGRAAIMDVVGAYPEIGMALSGEPEHMATVEAAPAKSPVIRIGFAIFRKSSVPAPLIMEYGGIIVSYIDALEAAGWRCELTLCMDIKPRGDYRNVHVDIVLKHAEDASDRDRILFAIANPAMSRRLLFRTMETFPELETHYTSNYGFQGKNPVGEFDAFIPAITGGETKAAMIADIGERLNILDQGEI